MPCLDSNICYRFLPRFAFIFCQEFIYIPPFRSCDQLIVFLFVFLNYVAIQEFFSVSQLVMVFV